MRLIVCFSILALTSCSVDSPPSNALDEFRIEPDEIYHLGFVVDDLDKAIQEWTTTRRFGPFFVIRDFVFENPMYRGKAVAPRVSLAFAFNGALMIELIEQQDETPSVYNENLPGTASVFHHFAFLSDDVDQSVQEAESRGEECSFRADFGDSKLAYCRGPLMDPGFVEYVQRTPNVDALLLMMYDASSNWDGTDPVRELT